MGIRKLRLGLAGLGRIGKKHAVNILSQSTSIKFVAACSPAPIELEWARQNLEPYGVLLYHDYEEMVTQSELDAVLIATSASVHETQILQALDHDIHVLCEKPLSTDVDSCYRIVEAAEQKPHLKVMCGFSRRFDRSYQDAKDKINVGLIGEVSTIQCQTCDKFDAGGFFVQYSAMSGGIFVDMGIHDVDLTLWYFGEEDAKPKTITATGSALMYPDLLKTNDRDNAIGMIEFHDGKVAQYYVSRTMAHGQDDSTMIVGTQGKITVNAYPAKDFVNLCHAGGITREIQQDFWARFEHAFAEELRQFVDACLNDRPLPMKLRAAATSLEISAALQEALVTGKQIHFDQQGKRIERAVL